MEPILKSRSAEADASGCMQQGCMHSLASASADCTVYYCHVKSFSVTETPIFILLYVRCSREILLESGQLLEGNIPKFDIIAHLDITVA